MLLQLSAWSVQKLLGCMQNSHRKEQRATYAQPALRSLRLAQIRPGTEVAKQRDGNNPLSFYYFIFYCHLIIHFVQVVQFYFNQTIIGKGSKMDRQRKNSWKDRQIPKIDRQIFFIFFISEVVSVTDLTFQKKQ